MCAFPEKRFSDGLMASRVTRASPAGNAGQSALYGAENSAAAASIAGGEGPRLLRKTLILLDFSSWHGVC
jgi:hypothetical protein